MNGQSQEHVDPWWDADDDRAHEDLFSLMGVLDGFEKDRQRLIALGLALYGDRNAQMFLSGNHSGDIVSGQIDANMSYNLVKSVIDAAQAHIAAQHTLTRVLTQHGDWTMRRKAKKAEQLIEGDYERNDVHRQAHLGFLDAAKTGTTGFKVCTENGQTKIELVRPGEVIVDPVDGEFRDPRAAYQIHYLARDVAMGMFGDADDADDAEDIRAAIATAPTVDPRKRFPWRQCDTNLEMVEIIEAWRRPDPEDWHDAQPGRHVIAIQGATLVDEEWDRRLPFVFWRCDTDTSGMWGRGMAHNLFQIQVDLNYLMRKISRVMHMNSGFHVIVDGTLVTDDDVTDLPGQVYNLRGGGGMVQQLTTSTIPQEWLQMREDLIRHGYEQEGVSQMGATSKKPSGLESGAAIREYNDIESARFAIKSKSFERFIGVDLATLVLEEKRWAAENKLEKPTSVHVQRRRGIKTESIKWSDISLELDSFVAKPSPSSDLPRTSAGRQAQIDGWFQAGFLNREQHMMLTRSPDLASFLDQELAPYDLVLDAIETMLEDTDDNGDPVFVPPDPTQDIQLSLKLVSDAYQRAVIDKVPDERQEMLRRYMVDLKHMQSDAMAAAQPAPTPPGMPADPGMGGMPPEAAAAMPPQMVA